MADSSPKLPSSGLYGDTAAAASESPNNKLPAAEESATKNDDVAMNNDMKPPALPLPIQGTGTQSMANAIATSANPQTMPDFLVSDVRKKGVNGASLCMAVGCEKNSQARTQINNIGGFCRVHYNAWLIGSGQIESWDCECGNKVSVQSDRCGVCHRWKGGRHACKPKKSPSKPRDNGSVTLLTHVPASSGVVVSTVRRTNEKGRSLCKVDGCTKLDQSKNDGFCRTHYNMFAVVPVEGVVAGEGTGPPALGDAAANESSMVSTENWTCSCGTLVKAQQKRCGKCHKWKGGKREPYKTKSMKECMIPEDFRAGLTMSTLDDDHWTCGNEECGNKISSTKSRCGKCHSWRGGKRKGGWKIKVNQTVDDSGIEWEKDWSCCDVMIPAAKKRCGKCNKWRGGKRVAKVAKIAKAASAKSGNEGAPSLPMATPVKAAGEMMASTMAATLHATPILAEPDLPSPVPKTDYTVSI